MQVGKHAFSSAQSAKTPLLSPSDDPSLFSRIASKAERIFDHRYTFASSAIASTIAIGASVCILYPTLFRYVDSCINELNVNSKDLTTCKAPYASTIATCQRTIVAAAVILGYTLQKIWEYTPLPPGNIPSCWDKVKQKVAAIQNTCSYEMNLGLGYLYNGLWIYTFTPTSWKTYFGCQTAAMAVASSFLGMYIRVRYKAVQMNLSQIDEPVKMEAQPASCLKKWWKTIAISNIAIAIFSLSFVNDSLFSDSLGITRVLCTMTLSRSLGHIFANKIQQASQNITNSLLMKRVTLVFSAALKRMPGALVGLGGYFAFFSESPPLAWSGSVIIGLALGIKDTYYQQVATINRSELNKQVVQSKCRQAASKICTFIKQYWRTGALLGFIIAVEETSLLECYYVTKLQCPISLEISRYYVNIDGKGLNIAIIAGLTNYYAIKMSKYMSLKGPQPLKKVSDAYLNFVDKYQFDLLSVSPFALALNSLDDRHAYNPRLALILIGFTMGTYNQHIRSGQTDNPYRPVFTNLSAVSVVV